MGKSKELAELGDVVTQSGGNVGIGSNPTASSKVLVTHSGSTFDAVRVNSDTVTDNTGIYLRTTGTAGISFGSTSSLAFFGGGAGLTERMRIDASGRVTMPYQPIFYARNHETANGWVSGTELYGFYDTLVNIGGHMNTSTGRFTAPVSGTYYLEFSAQEEAYYGHWGDGIFFRIRVNGVDKILCGNDTGVSDLGGEMFISFGGYVYMNAGDYASIYGDVGGSVISLERYVGGFGGHLVG